MEATEIGFLRQELAAQVLLLKQCQKQLEKLASDCNNITAMLSMEKKTVWKGAGYFIATLSSCSTEKVALLPRLADEFTLHPVLLRMSCHLPAQPCLGQHSTL